MGLHDEITADIAIAFDTDLADAVKPFTGERKTSVVSDDDWLINDVGNNAQTVNYSGRGIFGGYSELEIDNQSIKANDVKLICLADDLTDTPALDDLINGMSVVAIQKDPADVSFTMQLRKT
ncbi:glutamate 5-kinase [Moraxella boevrei]|uniref:glutamate 5-kinase n=1 Tax=Faucicola boevrei TaxID=346665 RepID=UPI00373581F5